MTLGRYWRLLRQDLLLVGRHGGWIGVPLFTILLCYFAYEHFDGTAIEIPGVEPSVFGLMAAMLYLRSLPFCIPLLLVVLTARVIANPIRDHTIREDLVRPIRRESLLFVRFCALSVTSATSLLICVVLGAILGATMDFEMVATRAPIDGVEALGGSPLSFTSLMSGCGTIWLIDMAVIAMAMLISVLVQPTGRVLLFLGFEIIVETICRGLLDAYAFRHYPSGQWASDLAGFLPGRALTNAFAQWAPTSTWTYQPLLATISIIIICSVLAASWFRRLDIS